MYRNAMAKLLSWSDSPSRKPLIVNGARQVGKTWLVLAFGADRYDSVAHVVFLDNEDMKRAFEGSLDAERLLTIIGAAIPATAGRWYSSMRSRSARAPSPPSRCSASSAPTCL